jgi:hypothetical protein
MFLFMMVGSLFDPGTDLSTRAPEEGSYKEMRIPVAGGDTGEIADPKISTCRLFSADSDFSRVDEHRTKRRKE